MLETLDPKMIEAMKKIIV